MGGSKLNVNNPAIVSQQARTKAQFSFQNKHALMRIFIPNKTITSIAVYSRPTRKKKIGTQAITSTDLRLQTKLDRTREKHIEKFDPVTRVQRRKLDLTCTIN